jgi:cephalosporin-C deacetylase
MIGSGTRGMMVVQAWLGMVLATTETRAMTCNVYRPYCDESTVTIPAYSRLRTDMIFRQGDAIELFAFPRKRPVRGTWALSLSQINAPFLTGEIEPCMDQSVRISIPADKLGPGFYDVRFTVYSTATNRETGIAGFGYRIEDIPLMDTCPPDFDAFWQRAKEKVEGVPLNARETFVREMTDKEISDYNVSQASIPEDLDPRHPAGDGVKVYKVQFDSWGSKRMYAWLAIPAGKPPFPGLLVLPGAGCGRLPAPVEHARHGYAALMLQIHGLDVDQETYETPATYLTVKGGPVEDEYYYGVYLACVQAVRYLASRSDVDPRRLGAVGASQGAMLSIVTAALCPNVKAVVAPACYYADWPWRDQVAAINAGKGNGLVAGPPPFARDNVRQNTLGYYDPVNFASLVKAATLMGVGLCDTPSPPPTVYAVYRRLGATTKALRWSPGTNHDLVVAFEREAWLWLEQALAAERARLTELDRGKERYGDARIQDGVTDVNRSSRD